MKVKILAFGIAKDIFGKPSVEITIDNSTTIGSLKTMLEKDYPQLQQLKSFMVARNNEYALDEDVINAKDEIAIIPPVSGG